MAERTESCLWFEVTCLGGRARAGPRNVIVCMLGCTERSHVPLLKVTHLRSYFSIGTSPIFQPPDAYALGPIFLSRSSVGTWSPSLQAMGAESLGNYITVAFCGRIR